MIYVLQNMNQKVIAVTGANIFRSLYASTAFILELFIHFFFRSESSLKIPWAHLIFSLSLFSLLKGIFSEKIGIDWLRSIKPNKQYKWFTNTFFILSFVWRYVEYCAHTVPFPGFHQVLLLKFLSSSRKLTCENLSNFLASYLFLRFSNLSILTYYLYILASKFCAIF